MLSQNYTGKFIFIQAKRSLYFDATTLSLDQDQKEELIQVLEKLLSDKTTLVVGSAVMAFEEVCPDRVDLIHKNYRKLCSLLVDVDEWGQVVIINMLTRYARSQFTDPNINVRNLEKLKSLLLFYQIFAGHSR
jgi:vesicle coat complex subunit